MSNTNAAAGGMGFFGWLTILFVALKLLGYIDWSWWAVLAPIWVSVLIGLIFFLIGLSLYCWAWNKTNG